ncbi:putative diguanylate cyclase YcdT [mine drainage metagenome]|uniref:Putative diguanylate cyclase YcdT n=1 Tax=mine drainage metagenome TaxID=410659 RepID=A0A1J5S619_9ZZZZ
MPRLGSTLDHLAFGAATFGEGQEFRRFQYRFTCAILLFSIIITAFLHLAVQAGLALLDPVYARISQSYLLLSLVHYLILRGRPAGLMGVAASYAALSLGLHGCTLFFNTPDELRIIWFILNLPGVYLVLGQRVGIAVTVISLLFVLAVNGHLAAPYSPSAIFTFILGLSYLSALLHAFTARSISFHHAMVAANRRLAEMAARDPLTGLMNARAYYARCEAALKLAARTGTPFSILFIDLDHFKQVNDRHGHEAGDIVLKSVAAALSRGLRDSDLLGRIGGEEFSALLPDTGQEGAAVLAEKLRQEVEYLMPDIGGTCLRITASIGVASGDGQSGGVAAVQKQADEAMYRAKQAGRNRVTCFALART